MPGVSVNDLTDPDVVEGVSGNAVLNGVPVTVEPLAVALAADAALADRRSLTAARAGCDPGTSPRRERIGLAGARGRWQPRLPCSSVWTRGP